MKVAGVIAEYNPFHKGHEYHLKETRRRTGADYIVVVMSGNFVQRGVPAMIDKYTRTRFALQNGADAVFEMPALCASSSAEIFAGCGVSLLTSLGAVDFLSFGSEQASLPLLLRIAKILADEPEEYRRRLQSLQKEGNSYARSVCGALTHFLSGESLPCNADETSRLSSLDLSEKSFSYDADKPSRLSARNLSEKSLACNTGEISQLSARNLSEKSLACDTDETASSLSGLLSTPNNLLGIEYLKALFRTGSLIRPCCIERAGSGYHSKELSDGFSSSTAIRRALSSSEGISRIQPYVPENVFSALSSGYGISYPVTENDLSQALEFTLLKAPDLSLYADIPRNLANRIQAFLLEPKTFQEWISSLKSKNLTYSHISRALLHAVLDFRKEDMLRCKNTGFAPYARLLGFRRDASALLSAIGKQSRIPLITKVADAKKILSEEAYAVFEKDLDAARMYRSLVYGRYRTMLSDEYRAGVVIL